MRLDPFHRRLDPASRRPVVVAVSGGADSILALRLTSEWAKTVGREVVALYVDHGLQAQSGAWAAFVAAAAADLGASFEMLSWDGPKPASGIPAAARRARHSLLAEAARRAGATAIVTGHTGDDILENAALGQGVLTEWSPSPVWPEGRGLFLLRPLLALRRTVIRQTLAAENVPWIDDPSNENPLQPRIAARQAIASEAALPLHKEEASDVADLARSVVIDWDVLSLSRTALTAAPAFARRKVLAAALVSAGGGERAPRGRKLTALLKQLDAAEPFTATLAGARLSSGETVTITREIGDTVRRPRAPLRLASGEVGVWDGRYEIQAAEDSTEIHALRGLAASLPVMERTRLRLTPAAARPALPAFVRQGRVTCPILAQPVTPGLKPLVGARFLAACGVTAREGDLLTPPAWRSAPSRPMLQMNSEFESVP